MSSDRPLDLDLAIIGMAGRFPGAGSVEAFWANLRAGVESIPHLGPEHDTHRRVDGIALLLPARAQVGARAAERLGVDLGEVPVAPGEDRRHDGGARGSRRTCHSSGPAGCTTSFAARSSRGRSSGR